MCNLSRFAVCLDTMIPKLEKFMRTFSAEIYKFKKNNIFLFRGESFKLLDIITKTIVSTTGKFI